MRFGFATTPKAGKMAEVVYALCGITSAMCALLLLRAFRRTGVRLLLWATICFLTLCAQNVLLFLDLVVFINVDLSALRAITGAAGVSALLFGIINDGE